MRGSGVISSIPIVLTGGGGKFAAMLMISAMQFNHKSLNAKGKYFRRERLENQSATRKCVRRQVRRCMFAASLIRCGKAAITEPSIEMFNNLELDFTSFVHSKHKT